MFNFRVLRREQPNRSIALQGSDHVLIFHHNAADERSKTAPRCQVEFSEIASVDLKGFRPLGAGYGTLGLVTLNEDVFVCVITGASQAANVRPGESVAKIDNVDFCMLPFEPPSCRAASHGSMISNGPIVCLNRSEYELGQDYESSSQFAVDERPGADGREVVTDHPFLALKKLLGDGSFYYSLDFNLTDRLQDR